MDYYELLGVERDATIEQIKSAYRKAALKHHPDRNQGDKEAEDRFKQAARAYAVLADPEKRARYDRYGEAGLSGAGAGGFDPAAFADFEDIFGGIFGDIFGFDTRGGRSAGRGGARRGQDLRFDLEIEFEEAILGTETQILVPHMETCGACAGTRAASASDIVTCSGCEGSGQQRYSKGFFTIARTCGQCGGRGRTITRPCPECSGAGEISREKTLKVKLPGGVETHSRLRIPGAGDAGPGGGPPGDLYVYISVKDHEVFRRDGLDLICTLPITFSQAALGATFNLRCITGVEKIKIPAGVQSGTVLRLRGKGAPDPHRSVRGDLLVEVAVRTPGRLSRASRKLIEKLQQSGDETLPAEDAPILERLQ